MILIDAAQINIGGALVLLKLLVKELRRANAKFILIKDIRCQDKDILSCNYVISYNPIQGRKKLYNRIINDNYIKTILCFCSFPPPQKYPNQNVITYFHNPNLLKGANLEKVSYKTIFLQKAKIKYLNFILGNTDYFIFQSRLIQKKFQETYKIANDKCKIFPFYEDEKIRVYEDKKLEKIENKFCYISIPYPHKNHELLFECWHLLRKENLRPELVVTIPSEFKELNKRIKFLIQEGVNIRNIGRARFETVLEETATSEFCIFPSLQETLGLGLMEAQRLKCKIVAADLLYVKEVVKPSLIFNVNSLNSMKKAVKTAMHGKLPSSYLNLQNSLREFISFLICY